jgi:hypothetical protein
VLVLCWVDCLTSTDQHWSTLTSAGQCWLPTCPREGVVNNNGQVCARF